MRVWVVPFLMAICLIPEAAFANGVTARQVVLQPKDVPTNVLVKSQTHAVAGYGACSSGYQSLFGSGLNGPQALSSIAYRCPSAAGAAQLFSAFASWYEKYYDRQKWDFKLLPDLPVGQQHAAWFNAGLPGTVDIYGKAGKADSITVVFQRDNFLVFLQVTYVGETLRKAEHSASLLGHIMNRHITSGQ
ncbi:MAG: hypothetical protein ACRDFS_09845 [Chloroflexota bacterium]